MKKNKKYYKNEAHVISSLLRTLSCISCVKAAIQITFIIIIIIVITLRSPAPQSGPPLELRAQQTLALQDGHVQAAPFLLDVERVVPGRDLHVARLDRALNMRGRGRGVGMKHVGGRH